MRIILLSFLFCFTLQLYSQDTIYFRNNNKIVAKVFEIDDFNITYKIVDSTNRRQVIIPKNAVRYVVYSNGSVEICSLKKINPNSLPDYTMFLKGVADAAKYYRHPCGKGGTFILSFLTGGILGLIPAIACSSTRPKTINLGLPVNAPVTNKDYMLGYIYKAKKMKQAKVWTGYGMGVGAAMLFALLINA